MKAFILFMENLLSRPGTASGISLREAIEAIKAAFPVPRNHKSDLPYAVRDLSRLLTQERGALHQSYWSAPRFVAAYTHFFLPWNLYRLSWLLPSLRLSLPAHGHVVDLGSGPLLYPTPCVHPCHQRQHLRIDCRTVSHHMSQRRPAQQAALGSRVACTYLLVVGVEEHAKAGVKRAMSKLVCRENKGFEKPAAMRQMPLGRAGIGHGLHAGIFSGQRCGQPLRMRAHPLVLKSQCRPVGPTGMRRPHGLQSLIKHFTHGHE